MTSDVAKTRLATLELQDVNIENIYIVKRVKLPNFQAQELDIPEDDEGMIWHGHFTVPIPYSSVDYTTVQGAHSAQRVDLVVF